MCNYYKVTVKVSEDSLRDYLLQYCDDEEIEEMDLDNECVEVINGILQDHFSDFWVIGKNSLVIGEL